MPRRYKQRHEGHNIIQAAQLCGISHQQLRYAIRVGDCPAPELGERRKYYSAAALIKLVEYFQNRV